MALAKKNRMDRRRWPITLHPLGKSRGRHFDRRPELQELHQTDLLRSQILPAQEKLPVLRLEATNTLAIPRMRHHYPAAQMIVPGRGFALYSFSFGLSQ